MSPFELGAGRRLEVLLRAVREFFDRHDQPFLSATSNTGQAHTFKTPTKRLKERFAMTEQITCFYSCASKVGTAKNFSFEAEIRPCHKDVEARAYSEMFSELQKMAMSPWIRMRA